jgi:hypothetical protein
MTDGPVQLRVGDSNNAGSFSTDYIGGNYRWPDGTYEPGSFKEKIFFRIMWTINRDSCIFLQMIRGYLIHYAKKSVDGDLIPRSLKIPAIGPISFTLEKAVELSPPVFMSLSQNVRVRDLLDKLTNHPVRLYLISESFVHSPE